LDARAQAQFLALSQHASFAELAALPFIKQLPGSELRQIVLHAKLFWDLLRGAHIRYNWLLQKQFGSTTLEREYGSEWAAWRDNLSAFPWSQWDTAAMWTYVAKAGGRVHGYTRRFVERWIDLSRSLPQENEPFNECVRKQELANKGLRARLRPDNRGEKVSGWIGIDTLAYRLPQAWRIVSDIHQAK
jgi:hypothetical protein